MMPTDSQYPHHRANSHDGPHTKLEIPLVLPECDDDHCVDHLLGRIAGLRGITEAHIDSTDGNARLCLHYDANQVALAQVERLARDAGAAVHERFKHESLRIPDMDCGDCAQSIEHVIRRARGVISVSVSYPAERMRVEYDSEATTRSEIIGQVVSMGYSIKPETEIPKSWLQAHDELTRSLLSGILLASAFAVASTTDRFAFALPLYMLAYLAGGYDIARHGLKALARGSFTIDLLMTVAAGGAAALGEWAEGGLLLFLFSLGHALEEEAMNRARNAIGGLEKLTPKTARVDRGDMTVEIPIEEIERGDIALIRPGERIPVDGIIREGTSNIDASALTGESLPVECAPGDTVLAGAINGTGGLSVETTKLASESTLAHIIELVGEAQTQKSPTQLFVERFARFFVPTTLGAVALILVVPPLFGWLDWREAFLRSMSVLVSASPCALAIATPAAVLSAIASAARRGILVKGGLHLENLGRIRGVAFDKTGTLTRGQPIVTDVHPLAGTSAAELLRVAAAAEELSSHPLARAIVDEARSRGLDSPPASNAENIVGRGIRARLEGKEVHVGSASLFAMAELQLPDELRAVIEKMENEGRTTMLVHYNDRFLGALGVADAERPEAPVVLERLRKLGIERMVLLTGDNERVGQAVASRMALDEARSDLLPEDKLAAIRELLDEIGPIAMVGDGVNDAPALATATVGIAMGAAGTAVALETADVALMADNLEALPAAIELGRRTRRIVAQNLVVALGVVALLVPLAITGNVGIGWAIFFHEGSTLAVVGNALRLLRA
jgi:Cd2+/Zn2+-exporting ATPase